jgi:hypothetical protein
VPKLDLEDFTSCTVSNVELPRTVVKGRGGGLGGEREGAAAVAADKEEEGVNNCLGLSEVGDIIVCGTVVVAIGDEETSSRIFSSGLFIVDIIED